LKQAKPCRSAFLVLNDFSLAHHLKQYTFNNNHNRSRMMAAAGDGKFYKERNDRLLEHSVTKKIIGV
jgi:hypothetical protein